MAALTITNLVPGKNFGPAVRFCASASIDAGSVTGSSHLSITGSMPGTRTDMVFVVGAPTSSTAAQFVSAACDTNDTITFNYVNPGASATPTSGTYTIIGF